MAVNPYLADLRRILRIKQKERFDQLLKSITLPFVLGDLGNPLLQFLKRSQLGKQPRLGKLSSFGMKRHKEREWECRSVLQEPSTSKPERGVDQCQKGTCDFSVILETLIRRDSAFLRNPKG